MFNDYEILLFKSLMNHDELKVFDKILSSKDLNDKEKKIKRRIKKKILKVI